MLKKSKVAENFKKCRKSQKLPSNLWLSLGPASWRTIQKSVLNLNSSSLVLNTLTIK